MKFTPPVKTICRFGLILATFCTVAEASLDTTPPMRDGRFDITDAIRRNGVNPLAVRADNAPSQIIPRSGDFTEFGGLYRPAASTTSWPSPLRTR